MALLDVKQLTVSLTSKTSTLDAVSELTFQLQPGKTVGLVGESGAGKSMIGRTIAQLLPPGFAVTGGELLFDGEDLVGMAPERRRSLLGRDIAFIPQEPLSALNPVLTIGQQFREHLEHIGKGGAGWKDRAAAELEAVHLHEPRALLNRYPHQLSGGMCQRVLIAMAFASRPRLLIADEPTTALDVSVQARIVRLIGEMQKRDGTAVIFITHDLRLAAEICDDVIVLYAGRQAEYGPAEVLFRDPAHPYTRCLELAVPDVTGDPRGLYLLPERMPGLKAIADLKGCRFATRCPLADDTCHTQEPGLAEVAPGHVSACWKSFATEGITPPPAPAVAARGSEKILEARGLSKSFVTNWRLFGGASHFHALKAADFIVRDAEFVGVVGESGSGKSTLARTLIGLETPTSGTLQLLGRDIIGTDGGTRDWRQKQMQIVFQDPQSALNPRRKVGSIVAQALEVGGPRLTAEALEVRIRDLLSDTGLSQEMAARYPSQLSGGQKQRVNIARALCRLPRLLIADEIASGLDVSVQAQLLNLLLRLREELGFSMLFISHDLAVVRYLCDRVLVMSKGEIVEHGETEVVFSDPQHPYTRSLLAAVPKGVRAPQVEELSA
ncbi:dipeptide ABC transporter ATP-binding protein [Antarcticimicrobium sediminis]|uniref:ABC transporter ATP-binding protein n=1 Tax=Antarcticimicrobium sediminis TaxID=2546227 RepID=A0A4R5EPY8_9RHOB|nr:ABC transporter ATP-binding protein [Antarcticimicrobium sediminis]TDE36718.1 ABC transporter ATP-binding protein [Antarcticimicrobium sediminis]